jgi:ubiquinone/menaquinone biosynthesis C-methylase UbiE
MRFHGETYEEKSTAKFGGNRKGAGESGLELKLIETLEAVGIKRGQTVLDFGCGYGTYTIPAARIVGTEGRIYALDKDKKALNDLMQRANAACLANIRELATTGELKLCLAAESVDAVILFDVYHHYYFPQREERKRLMDELFKVIKSDGFLLVWPKHMESEAKSEIECGDFYLQKTYSGTLIHENEDIEKGVVMNFKKRSKVLWE